MISALKYVTLFLLLPVLLVSQSFTSAGNEWVQTGENLVGWRYPVYLNIEGDTSINGTAYRTVYYQDQEFYPVPEYVGAVREENDSVYVIPADNEPLEEFLIYDWTAIVGDTLSQNEFSWIVVENLTTITLLNGMERKQFDCGHYRIQSVVDTIRSPLTIIEGIGCTDYGFLLDPFFDLLGAFPLVILPEDMRCYSNDNELLWQQQNLIACDSIIVSNNHLRSDNMLSISPNPVIDHLTIELPDGVDMKALRIIIFDSNGRIMRKHTLSWEPETLELTVGEFPSGLYFLQLSIDGSRRYTSRFIKL
jgi:hypothetical protein